jgi:REP element-mobilizing transposase RayT
MPSSYVCLHHHIVFSTKGRQPWLKEDMRERLFQYFGGTIRGLDGVLIAAGGIEDHVHLLVSLSKTHALSDDLRDIKAESSAWIHKTYPSMKGFGWQVGYGAFTVSYSGLARVKEYIANQAEHHRERSFRDEFRALLQRHGIAFDERYIWD